METEEKVVEQKTEETTTEEETKPEPKSIEVWRAGQSGEMFIGFEADNESGVKHIVSSDPYKEFRGKDEREKSNEHLVRSRGAVI